MSDLISWIWYASLQGLRYETRRALREQIGAADEIFRAPPESIYRCCASKAEAQTLLEHDLTQAERIIARCEEENIDILTVQDAGYPARLRNIPDPPEVLYIRGRLPDMDSEAAVAIVGTRSCTPYGEQVSRNLGYGVAACGGLVVTGLAGGCDSAAAHGALMAGGRVVGVLGTAINEVYPAYNRELFNDVAAVGAIISEYPPDTPGNARFFPIRNRIIAALSLAAVVTEAPRHSGALITARRALDYGRDVFAVPGNVDAESSRGSNDLLLEGARICLKAWDVLSDYEGLYPDKLFNAREQTVPSGRHIPAEPKSERVKPKIAPHQKAEKAEKPEEPENGKKPEKREKSPPRDLEAQLKTLSEPQLRIVSVMTKPSMHIDDIIDLSGLSASTVLAEMTLLQIKGVIAQESGKRFTLKITKRG